MIKNTVKKAGRKTLIGGKNIVIKVPVLRKIGVKAKSALFPGMSNSAREIYNYQAYYPSITEYINQQKASAEFDHQPLISLILPTYNTPDEYLRECIDSVIVQSYSNWELCIADDASPDRQVVKTIEEYAKKDKRIKYTIREKNGHISEASNSAITLADGEFLGLLDHDDILWPNALYEMVKIINQNPNVDLIYTDEDKIDTTGKVHSYPFLKPDLSPEFLESCNYITHFTCIRTKIINEIGGFRKGCEGAQDWDLFIRVSEITQNIIHIPKILYSWRIHEASTAANTDAKPYVYEAQMMLLTDHLERSGRRGNVETGIITQHRTIKYAVEENDKISIFIWFENAGNVERLLRSFIDNEAGAQFDIIYLHQANVAESTKDKLHALAPNVSQQYLNYSKDNDIYQKASKEAKGNYLMFVHDNAEVVSQKWAKTIIGDAQLDGVGVVGPVLFDPTKRTILSAGVGVGYGSDGYLDMLHGLPFDDPHYARGLYAKSRRNTSLVNETIFAIKKHTFDIIIDKQDGPNDLLELCSQLIEQGYRHIYTPYVQFVVHGELPTYKLTKHENKLEDKYLNPNFDHSNQNMEVRAEPS